MKAGFLQSNWSILLSAMVSLLLRAQSFRIRIVIVASKFGRVHPTWSASSRQWDRLGCCCEQGVYQTQSESSWSKLFPAQIFVCCMLGAGCAGKGNVNAHTKLLAECNWPWFNWEGSGSKGKKRRFMELGWGAKVRRESWGFLQWCRKIIWFVFSLTFGLII